MVISNVKIALFTDLKFENFIMICGALRDLVPFAQFKKRENTNEGVLFLVKLQATNKFLLTFITKATCLLLFSEYLSPANWINPLGIDNI